MNEFSPPPLPPPLLLPSQLESLLKTGSLAVTLPAHITKLNAGLFSASHDFFCLPDAAKNRLFPCKGLQTEHGYYNVPDEKQYLTLRHLAPTTGAAIECKELTALIAELWRENAKFLRRMLHDIGNYLGFSPRAWDKLLQDCDALPTSAQAATPSLIRIFDYLPRAGVAEPHKDLGLLTLCVGAGKGLQIFDRASVVEDVGEGWQDAAEVTVLVGNMLHVLSSGRIPAGLHRVVGNPQGRSSIVFALRINTRHNIDLALFGGQGSTPAIEIWDGIRKGRINVNAQKEQRVKEREDFLRSHSG